MVNVVLQKQLVVTVDNRVGSLAEICGVISASRINVVALCAYAVDNKGVIMFVSENNKEAKRLLQGKKYDIREEDVILLTLENKPGALQEVTKKIADAGIDLNLVYASVDKNAKTSPVVLISEDNEGVLKILKV